MKSEERHQLLTNDLGVVTAKTSSFLEQHLATTIAIVCGSALIAAAAYWWNSTTVSTSSVGWSMLNMAQNDEDLGRVVDEFKGKAPAQWALLQVAEQNLQSGLPLLFSNRESGTADLKRAREGFEDLLKDKTVPVDVRERALWGMALCFEATSDGDTAKPIAAFERLIAEFPETMFKSVGEERIEVLKKARTKEFYAWFSKENPKPPEIRPRDFDINRFDLPGTSNQEDLDDLFPIKPKLSNVPAVKKDDPSDDVKKPDAATGDTLPPATPPVGEKPDSEAVKPENEAAKPEGDTVKPEVNETPKLELPLIDKK